MRWVLLLVGGLGSAGCDAVFGLDDTALPKCLPKQFNDAPPDAILTDVDAFSFSSNRGFGVVQSKGQPFETKSSQAANLELVPLAPPYVMTSIAVDPDEQFFFFTAAIEPYQIFAAKPTNKPAPDNWAYEPYAPKGVYAGTPSDARSGKPVRVVVRLFQNIKNDDVKAYVEYERNADGAWFEVGERFAMKAYGAANLSPDGLVLVYDGYEDNDERGIYVRQRTSYDAAFRDPAPIFPGEHAHPQLFDDCSELYTIDTGSGELALTRYKR